MVTRCGIAVWREFRVYQRDGFVLGPCLVGIRRVTWGRHIVRVELCPTQSTESRPINPRGIASHTTKRYASVQSIVPFDHFQHEVLCGLQPSPAHVWRYWLAPQQAALLANAGISVQSWHSFQKLGNSLLGLLLISIFYKLLNNNYSFAGSRDGSRHWLAAARPVGHGQRGLRVRLSRPTPATVPPAPATQTAFPTRDRRLLRGPFAGPWDLWYNACKYKKKTTTKKSKYTGTCSWIGTWELKGVVHHQRLKIW